MVQYPRRTLCAIQVCPFAARVTGSRLYLAALCTERNRWDGSCRQIWTFRDKSPCPLGLIPCHSGLSICGTFATKTRDEAQEALVASLLRVEGMFNVNSTSVEAWKSVLSSLRGTKIPGQERTGAESVSTSADIPVAGLLTPVDAVADPASSSDARSANQWMGRRELTDKEIGELAEAIVREVRKRGPFLSISDFVNRRTGSDKELAVSGTVQSALDSADVSINAAYRSRIVNGKGTNGLEFPEAEPGPLSQGIPGIVKQGDILTPIAPFLFARSDTFVIRGYGESRDSNGSVTARAWCEATVERGADFVNPSEKPETALDSLTESSNRDMGRRFSVKSFRWLNADEI